jgi:hypothetical protein
MLPGLWCDGDLCKLKYKGSSLSSIAAVCSLKSERLELRVFYQIKGGVLCEAYWASNSASPLRWSQGVVDSL